MCARVCVCVFEYFIIWLGCFAVGKWNRVFCWLFFWKWMTLMLVNVSCVKEMVYRSWHLDLPTRPRGRLEQLPLDQLGGVQNVCLCQLFGRPAPSPSHPSFLWSSAFKPQPAGSGGVDVCLWIGVGLRLLEVWSCLCLEISCFSQSIKPSSTQTPVLFGCYVSRDRNQLYVGAWLKSLIKKCPTFCPTIVTEAKPFHCKLPQQEKHT